MEFKLIEVCDGSKNCKNSVVADGTISPKSSAAFLKFAERLDGPMTIFLNGGGTDLASGMALGKLIRGKGFDTQTGLFIEAPEKGNALTKYTQRDGGECISACLLAFMGGNSRTSQANDVLGFYKYPRKANDPNVKKLRAEAVEYMTYMGINPLSLDYLNSGNSEQIQRIPFSTALKFNIDNHDLPFESPWRIKTTSSGQLIAVVSEKSPSLRTSTTLALTKTPAKNSLDSSSLRLIIFVKPFNVTSNNSELLKLVNETSNITIINSGKPIDGSVRWERYQEGAQSYFLIPIQSIEQLTEGRFFDLIISSPGNLNTNSTTRFSTEGLKSALLAIKK